MGFPGGSDGKESVMQETGVQFLVQEEPMERMATQSRIPTWSIPWTEEPGKLQSMGVAKSWTE